MKGFFGHVNGREYFLELFRSFSNAPVAIKSKNVRFDLLLPMLITRIALFLRGSNLNIGSSLSLNQRCYVMIRIF